MGISTSRVTEARWDRIARNSLLNLAGQAVPAVVGLVTIPVIVHALGPERFGVLGLVWAVFGAFGLLDLGVARAATALVAGALSRNERRAAADLVSAASLAQLALGAAGGLILAAASGLVVPLVLRASATVVAEGRASFLIAALALPVATLALGLRAGLEGVQRFDLANRVVAPAGAASFLVAAVAAPLGASLPAIVGLLVVVRVATCVFLVRALRRALPEWRFLFRARRERLLELFAFGKWVAISNVLNPVFQYLDRFVLGALSGAAAVGWYTAPFEALMRLLLVPGSLAGALIPAFASVRGPDGGDGHGVLGRRAVLAVTALLGLPLLVLAVLAHPLLRLWLGGVAAEQAATAVRILAAGVFVNALAHVPSSYLVGRGRPDLNAKLHLAELLPHVAFAWFAVRTWGIAGAALAWTVRVSVDAAALFVLAARNGRSVEGA